MKIEILKENFKNGLSVVEKNISKNLSLPILDNVLINTEDSFLSLTSTDLETVIKLWILSKVIQKGKVVAPVKFLSSFVSYLSDEKVVLETKGENLYIESKNIKTQNHGFDPEEFPIIPEFKNLDYLEVNNKIFCQGLSQIINIVSLSQTRPETSGIYFNILENKEGNLKIYFSENQVLFEFPMKEVKHPQIQITSRLIEGQYPNYHDI